MHRFQKTATLVLMLGLLVSCVTGNAPDDADKPDRISGKVIAVLDGDTYDVLVSGNKTLRVRMEGIDAPERGMPYYRVSKDYLADLCFRKQVTVEITGQDRHDRVLAFTYLNDTIELGHEMIRAGLAWHYVQYNQDPDLAALELEARQHKRGLWADPNHKAPWKIRALRRQGVSAKDSL
jgi:micrococcal nuclease